MSKATLYKYIYQSQYTVADEVYTDVGSSIFQLGDVKRAFKGSTDLEIWTGAGGTGTQLTEGTDYDVVNEDFTYTEREGFQTFTGIQVTNATYQSGDLYISYKALGSYTDPAMFDDALADIVELQSKMMDKASSAEAIAGTADTKIITPLSMRQGFNASGTAPVYACRAWVNFDGTTDADLAGTYDRVLTAVTVTAAAHGLVAGNSVYLNFTSGTAVDGVFTVVSVTNENVFVVTHGTSGSTSGNVTLERVTIRGSGNVSSVADNATGDYTVNFTVALPSANGNTVLGIMSTGGSGLSRWLSKTVNAFRLLTMNTSSAAIDCDHMNISIFE